MKGTKIDPSFYRLPRNPEWALVSALMLVFYLTLYHPDSIIVDYMGPVGTFMRYMNKEKLSLCYNILYATVVIHIAEAVYSFILCRRLKIAWFPTLLWVTQNLVFGFPSLTQLTGNRSTVLTLVSLDFFLNFFVINIFM